MFWIVGASSVAAALAKASGGKGVLHWIAVELEHSRWEGFTFCDLIFPLFVFLAGVSIVFSLTRIIEEKGRAAAVRRIVPRFLILFFLGVFYYGGLDQPIERIRWLGVLQRIALCYLFAGLLFTFFRPRALVGICVGILVVYWALMTFVPVPEVGAGSFEVKKNLANYLDSVLLPGRKWNGTWDPEGLLSTLPAISTCLLGVFAGLFMRNEEVTVKRRSGIFVLVGSALVGLGFLWGLQFPVIKKIWTSSYVLVAGGYSLILLGAFHFTIEGLKLGRCFDPFVWIGMNALTIYMAHNIVDFGSLARRFVGGDVHKALGAWGDFTVALVALLLTFLLARFLYRRRIFLRA